LVISLSRVVDGKGDEAKVESPSDSQGMLSQKLDAMLKEAKIDGELMSSLGSSIKNFESAAKVLLQLLNLWLQQKNTVKS
jgi:hypothetical protein